MDIVNAANNDRESNEDLIDYLNGVAMTPQIESNQVINMKTCQRGR